MKKLDLIMVVNFLAFVLCCALIIATCGGCSITEARMPDGTYIKRCRLLSPENLDSVSYDEGSFVIEGYKSEQAQIVSAAIKAALGTVP